jgi:uncharacterized membrane protein
MSFRRTFLTGLLVVLPVFATFWLISLVFGLIDASVTPLLFQTLRWLAPASWRATGWVTYGAPLVSVTLAVAVIYVIGLIGGNVLGRQVLRWLDSMLMHVPVVRSIYSATRQFVDTFSRPAGQSFNGVVLVEFPRDGVWTLGFLTGQTQGEVRERIGRELLNVFVPTTPNPTGGYLLFVPAEKVIRLAMSIDDAFRIIISGGVLTPGHAAAAPVAARPLAPPAQPNAA